MTPGPVHARHRGLSLVEVVIALAVTSVVLVAVLAAFRAQQATFYGSQKTRAAQGSARSAMLFLEQKLPLAGTGMDGSLAFDMSGWTTGPCPPELGACDRDSTTDSDELVFFARNLDYWVPTAPLLAGRGHTWTFVSLAGNTLTVTAREGDRFEKGQILQLVCQTIMRYAYVTVDTAVDGPADNLNPATLATADVAIQLVPANLAAPNPFQSQFIVDNPANPPLADTCFAAVAAPARVFQIDRYRLHVRPVARGGGRYEPFLMLDSGLDVDRDGDVDADDEVVVADGIETLQVGYSFLNPALATFGMSSGTAINFVPSPRDAGTTSNQIGTVQLLAPTAVPADANPFTESSLLSYSVSPANMKPERASTNQANISAVRVGVVARSPEPAMEGNSTFPLAGYRLFNFVGAPDWVQDFADSRGGDDGYQRFATETTINTANVLTQVVPSF